MLANGFGHGAIATFPEAPHGLNRHLHRFKLALWPGHHDRHGSAFEKYAGLRILRLRGRLNSHLIVRVYATQDELKIAMPISSKVPGIMITTKSWTSFLLAMVSGMVAGATAPAFAQPNAPVPPIPTESSRPIIPPGKVGPGTAESPAPPPESSVIAARINEITSRPRDFAGKKVKLTSRVEEAITPWILKLEEDPPLASGRAPDLLLVSVEPLSTMGFEPAWRGKTIIAIGAIRILRAADFRREYGRGVDDLLFRRYEGKPALVATSMKLAD